MLLEDLDDRLVARLAGERIEVDDGAVQLVVDVDVGDRDELEPLIVDPHELVGEDLAQRLADPRAARVLVPAGGRASACSHHRSLRGPSDQSKTSSPRSVRLSSATSEWASVATAFHKATASSPLGAFGSTGPKKLRADSVSGPMVMIG